MAKSPYSGYSLAADSRAALLGIFPPSRKVVVAHHVTHSFGSRFMPPPLETSEVVAMVDEDGVQVLVVRLNGSCVRPDGKFYHCTWSLDEGIPAKHSNVILAGAWTESPIAYPIKLVPMIFRPIA